MEEDDGVALSGDIVENEGAQSGGTSSLGTGGDLDAVSGGEDEIVISDTEPDIQILDTPDDETNPCWMNNNL